MTTGRRSPSRGLTAAARKRAVLYLGLGCLALVTACHSSHIEMTVENRTGAPIRLLEVDYPSASFGADALAAGATIHYLIQVQGSGPLKVQYTAANGSPTQINGPELAQNQEGALSIVLLPAGQAEFKPRLGRNE